MDGKNTACVVLPTYNEAENVSLLIPRIMKEAECLPHCRVIVLVVDDDSPDGTALEVRRLSRDYRRVFLLSGRKQGIGAAYQRGISFALKAFDPDLIIQMDADLQHDPALIPSLIRACDSGADIAIGSRLVPGGGMTGVSAARRAPTRLANRVLFRMNSCRPPHDFTSGFRCIRTSLLSDTLMAARLPQGYAFIWVFLWRLIRDGRPEIREIPLCFPPRQRGASKMCVSDVMGSILCLIRILISRG